MANLPNQSKVFGLKTNCCIISMPGPRPAVCPQVAQLAFDFGYLPYIQNNCCSILGVVCNGTIVTEIHWIPTGNKILTGNFNNPNWASLVDLVTVEMSNQDLSGTFPLIIASSTKLTSLLIQNNSITGAIPSLNYTKLMNLDIGNNLFSGAIPVLPNTIVSLNLAKNMFTGAIPSIVNTNLVSMTINNNRITGNIPNFPDTLSTFVANVNFLTGSLPSNVFNAVKVFDVSHNFLSGTIPNVTANVVSLKLQNNAFTNVSALDAPLNITTCNISNNNIDYSLNTAFTGKCFMLAVSTQAQFSLPTSKLVGITKKSVLASTIKLTTVTLTNQTTKTTNLSDIAGLKTNIWNSSDTFAFITTDHLLESTTTHVSNRLVLDNIPMHTSTQSLGYYSLSLLYTSIASAEIDSYEQQHTTFLQTTNILGNSNTSNITDDLFFIAPTTFIIIFAIVAVLFAGIAIEICYRQTKNENGDRRSMFSRSSDKHSMFDNDKRSMFSKNYDK